MSKIPFLLASDNPTSSTGLARITRELALRIHANMSETFDLATYGLGGVASKKFPWQQYVMSKLQDWAPVDLPRVWRDFAGDRKGVCLMIWNPSWIPWLADCEKLPNGELKNFLRSKPFSRWLYAPIDAEGPNGKMPEEIAEVCGKMDRTLFYTKWASEMYYQTTGVANQPHLPHGTDTSIFYPQDRKEVRKTFIQTVTGGDPMELHENVFLVGIIATNSARKDWDLGFRVCQELLKRGHNVGVWAHTNSLKGHWDIVGMAKAYGLNGRLVPTITDLSDEQMAEAYNACNVVLGIALGEGWGLVHSDSLACGVPVIHGNYAGATDYMPKEMLVDPLGFFADGYYGHKRPVFDERHWADRVEAVAGKPASLPKGLSWDECWPDWQAWLLEGVNG